MASSTEIVPVGPGSDGDPSHVPPEGWTPLNPPHIYLNKVAEKWMESRGTARPGVKYYLNQLPDGYRLFQKPRPSNAKIIDKHLYGHPGRGYFDSPNRFYPHFEHLMNNNGSNIGCPCFVCANVGRRARSITNGSGSIQPSFSKTPLKGAQATSDDPERPTTLRAEAQRPRVDEENTPDTIRRLLDKLKLGPIDQRIVEDLSLDWRASKKSLDEWFQRITDRPTWVPRPGEIVLFVRDLQGNQIDFDNSHGRYNLFNENESRFVGSPSWEAGVIGQVPSEPVTLEDIAHETKKAQSIAYSGFRVEPLAHPNESDKSISKRYKYVPLRQIRPFTFWQEFLKGIPETSWHPTIQNALTVASSIVLVDKFRFQGVWPEATIFCNGIYIGFELICLGDTIRLTPSQGEIATEFLEVGSIKLKLTNLDKASDNDYDDGHPYNSTIIVSGKAFTTDRSKAWKGMRVMSNRPPPKGMNGYDQESLFWLHEPPKHYQISFIRTIGRCLDAHPMLMWFPPAANEKPLTKILSHGLPGLTSARLFSSENDNRIMPGKSWYWGDSRLEVLGAETLNGIHSSYYDDLRDEKLEEWQDSAKILKKIASTDGSIASHGMVGRPPKKGGKSIMAAAAHTVGASEPEDYEEAMKTEEDSDTKKRSYNATFRETDSSGRFGSTVKSSGPSNSEDMDDSSDEETLDAGSSSSALEAFKRPRVVINIDS